MLDINSYLNDRIMATCEDQDVAEEAELLDYLVSKYLPPTSPGPQPSGPEGADSHPSVTEDPELQALILDLVLAANPEELIVLADAPEIEIKVAAGLAHKSAANEGNINVAKGMGNRNGKAKAEQGRDSRRTQKNKVLRIS